MTQSIRTLSMTAVLTACLCVALQTPAVAFHTGLGNAVAAQGVKTTDKAAAAAEAAYPPLPSCGANFALFTNSPVTDPALIAINPMGHVDPPGHTFPADHGYFFFNTMTTPNVNVFAPSDGWVVQTSRNMDTNGYTTGYAINFSPCAEVTLWNLNVNNLIPELAHPASATSTTCAPFNDGPGEAGTSCVTTMEVPVKAGQLLGTGDPIDFGPIEDSRVQISGFADPSRHNLNRGICMLNYFVPTIQNWYTSMLGTNNGATFIPRTTPPLCGTIMQDIPGTAQGDWFYPGASYPPDNPHLALIHHNIYPSTATFSIGTSIPNVGGNSYDIFPKTATDGTRINYDFGLVNDTQIYCYDSFLTDFVNGPEPGNFAPQLQNYIGLIQLSGSSLSNLTIEFESAVTGCTASGPGACCAGAQPWSFTHTSNTVTFQR